MTLEAHNDEGPDHASGLQIVADRHGVSLEAVRHLMRALEAGNGTMAQFDHPELGGMGQWFSGGMVMVGRMFDAELKARVAGLCAELADALPPGGWSGSGRAAGGRGGGEWWPAGLGRPSSAGAQNGLRYAYFPETRRLAIESDAGVALYDTGEHQISGVSQSDGALRFTGPQGSIALDTLRRLAPDAPTPARDASPASAPAPASIPTAPPDSSGDGDVFTKIERLAELHGRGVLTEAEFAEKKADLLSRL
ncbi:SHOCT domain-containing protein [Methylobacterium sp. E-025]|uniref:SHOCT domain-containing protein n=1 Tax=Methylobacterium sp. E-025 TaxID=2836561 RepID=UPI001FBB06AD|nr:SHOCT domain-containing protein [Methylobacterium sp. E-025]MCJ2111152.1 SHOCT domain-containing protein [Methylobacterium sp. E-025]